MEDLVKKSKRETRKAIRNGSGAILQEYAEARDRIRESDLNEIDKQRAEMLLVIEVGRKTRQLEGRARRQNSVVKMFEREIREEQEKARANTK